MSVNDSHFLLHVWLTTFTVYMNSSLLLFLEPFQKAEDQKLALPDYPIVRIAYAQMKALQKVGS